MLVAVLNNHYNLLSLYKRLDSFKPFFIIFVYEKEHEYIAHRNQMDTVQIPCAQLKKQ